MRTRRGVHQRQLLYLGELNDSQKAQGCLALDVLDESTDSVKQINLFPDDRTPPPNLSNPVQIRLNQMTLRHPRQWGGCWLAMELWNQLGLDSFWLPRLPDSRKGTGWLNVLKTLTAYRLLDPGSEWRLHRDWFKTSAMADLLGTPRGRVSQLEDQLFSKPWKTVQQQIEVKLAHDGEDLYVLTRSGGRCCCAPT